MEDVVVSEQPSPQPQPEPSQQSQSQPQHQNLTSLSPGLEFLMGTRGLIIQQQIEWGEVLLGINFNNRYHIVDDLGRRLYFAAENSDACSLFCKGNCRPWNIILFDLGGNAVMQGKRSSSCCCSGLCSNEVKVTTTTGLDLGRISQNNSCCTGSWNIHDAQDNIILLIQGPDCSICCPSAATCFEAEFAIKTVQGNQKIGRITKKFSGFLREMFTEADTFCVEYPADLHVNIKAVLIFGAFMIDFIYYENTQNRQGGGVGGNRYHHHHHHGMHY